MRRLIELLFLTYIFSSTSFSQLSGTEILDRVENRFREIKDYTAEALASVEMERLRIPRRKITIQFKQPDKFHYESDGFAIIPREGFGFTPAQFHPEKFNITLEGQDTIQGFLSYKLQLMPKENQSKKSKFFIWIDSQDWVIRKIESKPFENRLTTVTLEYGRVENKYLLPSNIRVELKSDEKDTDNLPDIKGMENMSRRLPRAGTITITFTKYLVNQNLPDELFEKEK